jgi:hypothetical protein
MSNAALEPKPNAGGVSQLHATHHGVGSCL